MKNLFICIAVLMFSLAAQADCLTSQNGAVVCGQGQCETDSYGNVFCAEAGGGAMRDQYGEVQCGLGLCAKDDSARVWCSSQQGGAAASDAYGKVKCLGGCNAGAKNLCREAR